MSNTLTIRLSKELAAWLEETSRRTGLPQGQIVREQLERARAAAPGQGFLSLAGVVRGPRDLSARKGFRKS
jgi:hypothetical protein